MNKITKYDNLFLEGAHMKLKILGGPNGIATVTTLDIFRIIHQVIEVCDDPEPDKRGNYTLPVTIRIVKGEERDIEALTRAGFSIEVPRKK